MHWISRLEQQAGPSVLVTAIRISGSAPRESGARMIVAGDRAFGSIGGGSLEFEAIKLSRELLETGGPGSTGTKIFGLGPDLNQCCGGAVRLFFEVFSSTDRDWMAESLAAMDTGQRVVMATHFEDKAVTRHVLTTPVRVPKLPEPIAVSVNAVLGETTTGAASGHWVETDSGGWWIERIWPDNMRPLVLFGAGHVGKAVIYQLAPLPFRITWVDSREGEIPADLPASVTGVQSDDPRLQVALAPAGSIFVVMTHSHSLDEDLCFDILSRDDFTWLGLIGSATKRRRFVHRLAKRGIPDALLDQLVCPIGLAGIEGKQPATIALSLAAQLMNLDKEQP